MNYVFIDFDDTLFEHEYAKDSPERSDLTPVLFKEGGAFYKNHGKLDPFVVGQCKKLSMRKNDIIVLTRVCNSMEAGCKKKYLSKEMPPKVKYVFYALGRNESKAKFIKAYCKAKGIKMEDAVLVDDDADIRHDCKHNNIRAYSPKEAFGEQA